MKTIFYCLVIILTLFLISCRHDTDLTNVPEVTYSEVQGILTGNCTYSGCHNNSGGNIFSLTSYAEVMDRGEVKPGSARSSLLYKVISDKGGKFMPPLPHSPLTNDQITRIFIWIEEGAKNN